MAATTDERTTSPRKGRSKQGVGTDPLKVWAVGEFHNCQGDDAQPLEGTPVIALYTSKQTAGQHRDRLGYGYVTHLDVAPAPGEKITVPPSELWAVGAFHNCQGDDAQELDGTAVIALYTSRQAAEQHRGHLGYGYATRLDVLTKLRTY